MRWDLRPARDIALPFADRLRTHARERGLVGAVGGAAWLAAVRAYLAVAHRFGVDGLGHLPVDGPMVLVANHTSHLDALALSAALPHRLSMRAVALAAGEVFFRSVPRAMFAATALNALPVWRVDTGPDELAYLRMRLIEDRLVFLLFPEGTRARDGAMGRFRPGLGALVAGSGVPVVPCHLDGAYACWPATRAWPRPGRVRLRIGPPLSFVEADDDRAGWKQVAAGAEAAVRALAT